jgi:methionyl aminopeptidase
VYATDKPVVIGQVSPRRPVPDHIAPPEYAATGQPAPRATAPDACVKATPEAIARMRRAGAAAREVLEAVLSAVKAGVRTDALDAIAHAAALERNAYPSPLNYRGFPKSLCTSVNEVICHGIPDDRPLMDGDIVNCDVTVYLDGMHGDCSETVFVGRPDAASARLVEVTYASMMAAIEAVKPGVRFNEIGRIIGNMAREAGLGVVRDFAGHGIGERFHMPPTVAHYFDRRITARMVEGMTFTIEPMLSLGSAESRLMPDGWTAVTADLSRSAQFEHTVLVTKMGAEILTGSPRAPFFQTRPV